ncbi:hypothetical protein SAY87_019937 [Trapa incisa]|uniref:Uncharacterized protein n=1 Tax=Trapa incisa TaxID=236973 RepID=A0AAN7K2P7_9MYRT|nr:hypothetical protein SAY87_019937 [Trapa incisa]
MQKQSDSRSRQNRTLADQMDYPTAKRSIWPWSIEKADYVLSRAVRCPSWNLTDFLVPARNLIRGIGILTLLCKMMLMWINSFKLDWVFLYCTRYNYWLLSGLPLRPSIPSQVAAAEVSPKENFDHRRRTTAIAASIPFTEVLTLLLFLVVLFQSPPAASSLDSYEALQEFNFPKGLLPKGVIGYELDRDSGKFRILFLWMNIVEVTRVNDLEFSVGIASASYDIDNFFESTQCGCGFDCGIEDCVWHDIGTW